MSQLALFGGTPIFRKPLPPFTRIGGQEMKEVRRVMKSGVLSGFIGAWGEDFHGGPAVRRLEEQWAEKFRVKHAVTVNSNTSGLFAAMGAIGVGPGDEVIVPPTTMSATAMAPLVYGGIPVFVDIEPETYCLDLRLVEGSITPLTKAIIAVNLFGHPARLAELRAIADRHSIYLIEDNAQAPLAEEDGRYAGTVGHIGVFSLNRHKHIQTGEGGVCCTDDDDLALKLKAIRNHGENIVDAAGLQGQPNLIGFNYRMTELSAAVGVAQLRRAESIIGQRAELAEYLTRQMKGLDWFTPPTVRGGCRHVYYVWYGRYHREKTGVSRQRLVQALQAEGLPVAAGYVAPLYRLPIFRQRIGFGKTGYPFQLTQRLYVDGMCPMAEQLHQEELLGFVVCSYDPSKEQRRQIVDAFHKVYEHRRELALSEAASR
ncbi:MAG: DegT/DnrJ/EryC1/StrS family aminotransferase [Magnetococcales bacterium]|nr:DegT/DnrJ/EryC1/StrS family aminotransferase [Magnetococcales bacterium]